MKKLALGLLMAAAMAVLAPAAFAENISNSTSGYSTTVTHADGSTITTTQDGYTTTICAAPTTSTNCTADTTTTTAVPYTVCTPVTTVTNLGYNKCDIGGDRSVNSGDFAMGGNCSTATSSSTTDSCSVAYNYVNTTVPGVCTTTTVPGACSVTHSTGTDGHSR